jgi:lipoprotein NlpD
VHRLVGVIIVVAALALPTSSCSARNYAPIRDQSKPQRAPEGEYRQVRSGDTLYSIAWESGLDVRDLADWNQIEPPYVIRPGQRLRLKAPPVRAGAAGFHTVTKGETLHRIAADAGVRMEQLAAWNRLVPPYPLRPGQRLRLTDPNAGRDVSRVEPRSKTATTRKAPREDTFDRATSIAWTWPTEGTMLARFGAGTR